MARIRPQVNPNQPIPNTAFSSPLNPYVNGPWFPFVAGAGVNLDSAGIPTIQNDVSAVLSAGTGITLATTSGITTISVTGGGGGGTVTSIIAGTGLNGGTITTSGTIDLANTAVTPGAYTSADITIDAQGRITAAANGSSGGVTAVTGTAPIVSSGGATPAISLANTAVTPGAYTYGSFTVDAQGRLTAAASGTAPVTSVIGTAPIVSSGGATRTISVNNATPLTRGVLLGCSGGNNTSVGENALRALSSGQSNTALGFDTLCSVTSGVSNTAVGDSAASKVTGTQNVAMGGGALFNNAAGNCNSAIGNYAMMFSSGSCNSALGHNSLRTVSGINNVGVGINAGSSLTSGNSNVAIGPSVQVTTATDSCQLAIGFSASDNWLTGNSTRAIRPGAGIIDCANVCGTAGQFMLSTGANAICWGNGSATPTRFGTVLGCTCNNNAALGNSALLSRTSAAANVAVGVFSGCTLTSGNANTLVGPESGCALTTGENNIAIGSAALSATATSINNIAIGTNAMRLTTGCFNVSVGNLSGAAATIGCHNVFIGNTAGSTVTSGGGNVIIGGQTAAGGYSPVNSPTTQSNVVVMSSNAVTDAYIRVAWTVTSDARDKIVEGDVPHGLSFVEQLEPKAYHMKKERDGDTPHGRLRYGFLAQDILALEGDSNVIIDNDDSDHLRYIGESLVPVLVNAIKELSAKVEALEAKLAANG